MIDIINGDCAQILPRLKANTHDSWLIDPPASIGFMGQEWDSDRGGRREWCAWLTGIFWKCLRVLKPGAHGLVWAIPRRSHWTALALEDAGFEIRDCIHHYFLSGFPKSLSVAKAIDKRVGAKRKVMGSRKAHDIRNRQLIVSKESMIYEYTASASPEAKEWDGWGTHLKPAIEHWWLVRKPLSEKTVVANVLKWGTGALNIDASRIPVHQKMDTWHNDQMAEPGTFAGRDKRPVPKVPMQEWVEGFPGWHETKALLHKRMSGFKTDPNRPRPMDAHPDSRYPSHFIVSDWGLLGDRTGFFHPPIYCPKARRCRGEVNDHPTVKPVELMKYFATLLTRPGGHVLDCFMGSGSTGVTAGIVPQTSNHAGYTQFSLPEATAQQVFMTEVESIENALNGKV